MALHLEAKAATRTIPNMGESMHPVLVAPCKGPMCSAFELYYQDLNSKSAE